jgi:hypothetical protein
VVQVEGIGIRILRLDFSSKFLVRSSWLKPVCGHLSSLLIDQRTNGPADQRIGCVIGEAYQ